MIDAANSWADVPSTKIANADHEVIKTSSGKDESIALRINQDVVFQLQCFGVL
jgi:hypothetical protein